MMFSYPEIDRLREILELETAGQPFNYTEGLILAAQLRRQCPTIAGSLAQMRARWKRLVAEDIAVDLIVNEGFSYREAAAFTGLSRSTLWRRVQKAKADG